jgi:hypothetical protein
MKKRISLIAFTVLVLFYVIISQFSWHLKRNVHNILPTGKLTLIETNSYQDENNLIWEIQPHFMNKFHQPDEVINPIKHPYSNMDKPPQLNIESPNLKLLSKTDKGSSYEAILQPNGRYLTSGAKQGTYNYGHPEGFIGITIHTFMDVIPHFINSNYKIG